MNPKIIKLSVFHPNILVVCLPLFPLIDFYLFKGFPYVTMVAYTLVLLFFARLSYISDITIAFFSMVTILSLLFNGIINGFTIDQLKYIVCYAAFITLGIRVGKDINRYIKTLLRFSYCYFFVNTLIFIYRLIVFEFDFNRVRMGTAIFGGNSAHFVFLMILLLLKDFDEYKKHYYWTLIIACLNAVLYTSKGAIIVTAVWILFDILYQKKTKAINWKVILFVLIGACIFRFYLLDKISGFLNFTIERFIVWEDLFKTTGGILGTRAKILEFCVNYIKEHPVILLIGNGPTFFRAINPWQYSNSHNLFMDVLFDTGLFGLIPFLIVCFKSLIKSNNKIFYLLCIAYATIEGVALFFIDGTSPIMTGFAFFLILVYYYSKKEKKDLVDIRK